MSTDVEHTDVGGSIGAVPAAAAFTMPAGAVGHVPAGVDDTDSDGDAGAGAGGGVSASGGPPRAAHGGFGVAGAGDQSVVALHPLLELVSDCCRTRVAWAVVAKPDAEPAQLQAQRYSHRPTPTSVWIHRVAVAAAAVVLLLVVFMAYTEPNRDTQAIMLYSALVMVAVVYRLFVRMREESAQAAAGGFTPGEQAWQRRMLIRERLVQSLQNLGNVDALRLGLGATDRDFDANDYERLLALDEDTPTTRLQGATQPQINRLPTYVFSAKAGSTARTCRVCLEDFQPGEHIRILPCFHQFHKDECIDRWLLQKAECPVCKASARGNEATLPI